MHACTHASVYMWRSAFIHTVVYTCGKCYVIPIMVRLYVSLYIYMYALRGRHFHSDDFPPPCIFVGMYAPDHTHAHMHYTIKHTCMHAYIHTYKTVPTCDIACIHACLLTYIHTYIQNSPHMRKGLFQRLQTLTGTWNLYTYIHPYAFVFLYCVRVYE
jgi:hypothetical protein